MSARPTRSSHSHRGGARLIVQVVVVALLTGLVIVGAAMSFLSSYPSASTSLASQPATTTDTNGTDGTAGKAGSAGVLDGGEGVWRKCEREGTGMPGMPHTAPVVVDRAGSGVPILEEAMPGVLSPVVHCWPHTQLGALAASVGFFFQLTNPQLDTVAVAQALVTRSSYGVIQDFSPSGVGGGVSVHGYAISPLDHDRFLVALALSTPESSGVVAWPLTVVWEEGDWRVELPATGRWSITPVSSLSEAHMNAWRVDSGE